MKLHENTGLFKQAIQAASDQKQIPVIYVEKDYWVTFTLYTLFKHQVGKDTVFKGGTALSKCYNMIDRFSEDIDLVVLRHEGETDNKLKAKLKTISNVISEVLPEIVVEGLTHKMGMNRKTAHSYNKEFKGSCGQVRDAIVVEATWLGYYEPCTTRSLSSFVADMMIERGQIKMAEQYEMLPFEVRVLEPVRTICEKIMSLVRFSYSENPIDDLKRKIRHTYDLHQLLSQQEFLDFLHSSQFDEMLLKVANDDVVSFRNNNQWLVNHPNQAIVFKDLDSVWKELSPIYNGDFKNLVYGTLPREEAVLVTLTMIKDRMERVIWTIKI